jgi:hypothetical protein
MTTENKKTYGEAYITTTQKVIRDAIWVASFVCYAFAAITLFKGKVDVATLGVLLGYIARQYHREYECHIESEACIKEWDAEREAEKAAADFAKQMEEAKAIEAKYKQSEEKDGKIVNLPKWKKEDIVTATAPKDTGLWYGYVDSATVKPTTPSDFKPFKPEPVPTPAKKPSKKKKKNG